VIMIILFIQNPDGNNYFRGYARGFMASLREIRTVENQWYIIWRLIREIAVPLSLTLLLYLLGRKDKTPLPPSYVKFAILFFVVGLAGSVPFALAKKQSGVYLVPSMPYFAISSALMVATLNFHIKYTRILRLLSLITLATSVISVFLNYGKKHRDTHILELISHMKGKINNTSVCVDEEIYSEWALNAYLERYLRVSLIPHSHQQPCNYLAKTGTCDVKTLCFPWKDTYIVFLPYHNK